MTDLLGDEIKPRSLLDPLHGFKDFWQAQPPGYKIARPQCEKKWVKYRCAEDAMHILMHMEYLKTTPKYLAGYIPNPETYLNRQDWKEWEPAPEKPRFTRDPTILAYEEHAKRAVPMPENLRRAR